MFCEFSHLATYDPIVDPGNDRFMHLHMFFGNTAVGHNSTYQSLRSSGDSTCDGGPLNRTAYWMPAVFDEHDQVVVPDYFELYYKAENADRPSDVQPYPNGSAHDRRRPRQRSGCGAGPVKDPRRRRPPSPTAPTVNASPCRSGSPTAGTAEPRLARPPLPHGLRNQQHLGTVPEPPRPPARAHRVRPLREPGRIQPVVPQLGPHEPRRPAPNGSTFHADWFGAWDNDIQDRWVTHCLHGERSASNGNLCDGQQLRPAPLPRTPPHPQPNPHILSPESSEVRGRAVRGERRAVAHRPRPGTSALG
jgi:hypothetical protein